MEWVDRPEIVAAVKTKIDDKKKNDKKAKDDKKAAVAVSKPTRGQAKEEKAAKSSSLKQLVTRQKKG
jgi:hypothetical protein